MPRVTVKAPGRARPSQSAARSGRVAEIRPSRWRLWLRRQRRLVRPAAWGLAAVAALGGAALAVRTVQPGNTVASLRERVGQAANLHVQRIVIEGRSNTPEPMLRAALGVSRGYTLLGFSLEGARARIESLTWVQSAAVERRLPDTIVVHLVERRPFAVWQNQGRFVLIDRAGQADAAPHPVTNAAAYTTLPLVVGAGAPERAAELLDQLAAQPGLKSRVVAAIRVGERRWNLRLNTGADVLLPEGAEAAAMARLMELHTAQALLDRPLQTLDMRLPDRLVVRPIPEPPPASASAPRRPT